MAVNGQVYHVGVFGQSADVNSQWEGIVCVAAIAVRTTSVKNSSFTFAEGGSGDFEAIIKTL